MLLSATSLCVVYTFYKTLVSKGFILIITKSQDVLLDYDTEVSRLLDLISVGILLFSSEQELIDLNKNFLLLVLLGVQISPVPAHFSQTATDVTQGKAGRGSIQLEGDNDGWVDMWVAVPAWAQGTGQIGEIWLPQATQSVRECTFGCWPCRLFY